MKVNELGMAISKAAGPIGLKLGNASPRILLAAGVLGLSAASIMACRATYLKLEEIRLSHMADLYDVKEKWSDVKDDQIAEAKSLRKEVTHVYIQTAADLTRLYGPSVALGIFSVACIAGSHGIMEKRNMALIAAYKAVEEAFNAYRARVVEVHGEEADYMYRYNLRSEDFIETDENGKIKKKKEFVEQGPLTGTARWYCKHNPMTDEGSTEWSADAIYNETTLRMREKYWNDILSLRKWVSLFEVEQSLGFQPTDESLVLGWVLDGGGEGYISFGLDKGRKPINSRDNAWLLDFNVDAEPIKGKIKRLKKRK